MADVQPGSIHHALNLLEQIDVEPGDGGPDRVAYRLTDVGEQEYRLLLSKALSDPELTSALIAQPARERRPAGARGAVGVVGHADVPARERLTENA